MNIIPERKLQAEGAFRKQLRVEGGRVLDIEETNPLADTRQRKYKVAGYGFLGLNSLYIGLAWGFMPPFVPGFPKWVFWPLVLILILFLTQQILRQKTTWVKTLTILSGLRFIASFGLILRGDYLPVVPYFLPCFIITFYLLGRAGWNWP